MRTVLTFVFAAVLAGITMPADAGTVTFRFRAPDGAKTVTVAGTFNDWNSMVAPMGDGDDDGIWETTLNIRDGVHQYKFVVNNTDWFTDEHAADFAPDGFGGRNSVINVGPEPMTVGDLEGIVADHPGIEVTFRYRPSVANVNSVSVAGSFNEWNAAAHVMTDADGNGMWRITIPLAPGEHAYQFVVNGDTWFTDPNAARYEPDDFGGKNALLSVEAVR